MPSLIAIDDAPQLLPDRNAIGQPMGEVYRDSARSRPRARSFRAHNLSIVFQCETIQLIDD